MEIGTRMGGEEKEEGALEDLGLIMDMNSGSGIK